MKISGEVLRARNPVFGMEIWQTPNRATWTVGRDSPWNRHHYVVGTGSQTPDGGKLLCLEKATGDTLWSVTPDDQALVEAFGPEIVGDATFSCSLFREADVNGDGVPELVVRFVHGLYYPCCLCLVDRNGQVLAQYTHRGHLRDFLAIDLDVDGADEILSWGTNNCLAYQGFTVLKLDRNAWSGASVDSLCSASGTAQDGSAVRLVVPDYPAPYMQLLQIPRLHVENLQVHRDTRGAHPHQHSCRRHRTVLGGCES